MKPESEKRLDKAARSLHAAELLLRAGETDFAAGRAYYAMLYVAEALLGERGQNYRKHTAVHAAYGREFAKTGLLDPKFHRWLLTAFDRRIVSDYDTEPTAPAEEVRKLVEQAQEFLQAARRFLAAEEGRSRN